MWPAQVILPEQEACRLHTTVQPATHLAAVDVLGSCFYKVDATSIVGHQPFIGNR
jgi:hypothetical protein